MSTEPLQIFDPRRVAIVVSLLMAFSFGLGCGLAMQKEDEQYIRKEIAADCADLGRFRNLGSLYACSALGNE